MAPVHLRELLNTEGSPESQSTVLRTVMAYPDIQTRLAERSGLAQATVSTAVRGLEAAGYVRTRQETKRDKFVEMVDTVGAAVGIELGFHQSVIIARKVEQRYHAAITKKIDVGAASGSPRLWVGKVAEAVRDVMGEVGEEDIAAIGLGVPRIVNPHPPGGLVQPALLPWQPGDNPAEMLSGALRDGRAGPRLVAPAVILDNDANLAAYAESVYESRDAETLIGIKASTGIGAGIVTGGRIFRGRRGVAGEIGHVVVEPGGRFCSCGGRGCLETLVGADALVDQAKTVLGHKPQDPPKTLEDVVRKAALGDVTCRRVLRDAASALGFAIGNLCNVLNPDVVVIGGAFGRAEAVDFTLDAVKEGVSRSAMAAAFPGEGVVIRGSAIEYAAAHGALIVALEGTDYAPVA